MNQIIQSALQLTFKQALEAQQDGNFDLASALCTRILQQQPRHFDALLLSGVIAYELGAYVESAQLIMSAIKIDNTKAEAFLNLGAAFKKLNSLDSALISYDKALLINPNYSDAHYNRGNVLLALNRFQEAVESYNQALKTNSNKINIIYNRANAYRELKLFPEALNDYESVIEHDANYALAYWNKAWTLLLLGRYEEAWPLYEWRWKNKNLSTYVETRVFSEPLWLGDASLENKTILIRAEQGLGDTIQFCRYIEKVAELGANVIFEVQPTLLRLLKSLESNASGSVLVIEQNQPLPYFDFQTPLLSLPYAFKTNLATIPTKKAYLHPNKALLTTWENKLGKKKKLRVGLVWSGSADASIGLRRSLALADLVHILPECFQYISLQKEVLEQDQMILSQRPDILHFTEDLHDFSETGALCALMDFVISIDTSVAHLAGALGKKTLLLLHSNPDWRWLLDRDDSPWYPSFKLYKQKKHGDWQDVLERIKKDLEALKS